MPLGFILVLVWLVGAPASTTVACQEAAPVASSTTSSPAAAADPAQAAPTKNEPPPTAEQTTSESVAKQKTETAPAGKTAKRRRRVPKGTSSPTPGEEPRKIVVREGGAIEPRVQIAPGLAPQEANRKRQDAVELLSSTEENLRQLAGRTLNSGQQETVTQIRNYADGARSALKDGDAQRAHTLALKAHWLAEDLMKH